MKKITLNQSPNVTTESDQNNNVESVRNNNVGASKNEKYSLRQRAQRGRRSKQDDDGDDSADNKGKSVKEKPKQKAAPLSKYRRKTANARERTRMREINTAFESLRKSVPVVVSGAAQSQTNNEKLTKITTLRMAMKYIKILNDILNNKTMASEDLLGALMETQPNNRKTQTQSIIPIPIPIVSVAKSNNNSVKSVKTNSNVNNSILMQNNHDYCKDIANETRPTKSAKVSPKKVTKTIVKQKREAKKQTQKVLKKQLQLQETVYLDDICNKNNSILHRSIKFDTSLSPPNDDSPAELGLILESDGESLQLSEPCFSPLELGLLLESDGESLHLSEPCLSPLNHLDALDSFNDLLNSGFSEPTALDMYWS